MKARLINDSKIATTWFVLAFAFFLHWGAHFGDAGQLANAAKGLEKGPYHFGGDTLKIFADGY